MPLNTSITKPAHLVRCAGKAILFGFLISPLRVSPIAGRVFLLSACYLFNKEGKIRRRSELVFVKAVDNALSFSGVLADVPAYQG